MNDPGQAAIALIAFCILLAMGVPSGIVLVLLSLVVPYPWALVPGLAGCVILVSLSVLGVSAKRALEEGAREWNEIQREGFG